MRAAVLRSTPGTLVVEDVTIDNPGRSEVLVRTAAAGVCHSDLHFVEGAYSHPTPCVLGHESAGVVEAVGEDVTDVRVGDHVITCLAVFCGSCERCLGGRPALCQRPGATRRTKGAPPRLSLEGETVHQFFHLSSFAEQMLVHQNAVVQIDPDVPLDRAALVGCGVTTGLGAVFRTAQVQPGDTVAVIGCGGIGLNAIQGARVAGAARIIGIDLSPTKLELATSFGATDVVDAGATDAVAAVRELTRGGVDHAFEAIGLKVTAEQAFGMLRPGGTATIIGMIPVGTKIELAGCDFLGERRIQGSALGSTRFRTDMPMFLELYKQGRIKLDELVSGRIGLDDLHTAFDELRRGSVTRNVVVFDGV
jgi:S-(hydroxymethyl)glutathione dehydrogenase/alcohol dehydrogenase